MGAFEGSQIVGGGHSHPVEMNVPGGRVACAAVDNVAVQPTHRRRGFMTQMMAHQLKDVHERGEPLAALWASESTIYGRFGYGPAVFHEDWSIERKHTGFGREYSWPGAVRFVELDEVRTTFPEVFRRTVEGRPGGIDRPEKRWERIFRRGEKDLGTKDAYFDVVYEVGGKADGYVIYRIDDGNVSIWELLSVTDQAYQALWSYCFGIDLTTTIKAGDRPVDDPLPWMLADHRRLERKPTDALWVRLVDVPAALGGRSYAHEGEVVFEVEAGTLKGGPDGAECATTDRDTDLAIGVSDLAAAYLGGTRFTTLALAGLVEERTDGALGRADAMFRADLAPWCPYHF